MLISEINNRSTAIENILDESDNAIVDYWHMLSFMKRPAIKYYKLLDHKNKMIFDSGLSSNLDVFYYSSENRTITNRGRIVFKIHYIIDRKKLLYSVLNDDRYYLLTISVLLIILVSFAFILNVIKNKRTNSIFDLLARADQIAELKSIELPSSSLKRIQARLIEILQQRKKQEDENILIRESESRKTAIATLASQVAHDIRSPLAALDMVMKDLSAIPESKRLMMRSASTRIHDIANNLLQKNRDISQQLASNEKEQLSTVLLPVIVEGILTEKRMQFRSIMGIKIISNIGAASYGLFAKVGPRELKRVCSNILNNAIESLAEAGNVIVDLSTDDKDGIELRIKDNGKGIPVDVLAKLGKSGVTYGKKGGNGLGLYRAKTSIESWGGSLEIESSVGVGTTIIIKLPRAEFPKSFVQKITLKPNSTLVIVDDDESIHQIWAGRLESVNFKSHNIKVLHFSSPADVKNWARSNDLKGSKLLVDYEYIGYIENGLDLIENSKLEEYSYLVTSRFEEKHIQDRCDQIGIGLIPKTMAGFVPLAICSEESVAADLSSEVTATIFVDDDDLVRLIWESSSSELDIPLKVYSDPYAMLKQLDTISKESTFYIDSNLENDVKGEDILKKLFELGYKNLYLATGYEPEEFEDLDYIKGVIGKEPPWLV